jgi:hypothetical protein
MRHGLFFFLALAGFIVADIPAAAGETGSDTGLHAKDPAHESADSWMERKHGGGISGGILVFRLEDVNKIFGLVALSGDFHLWRGLYLSLEIIQGFSYDDEGRWGGAYEWLFPFWLGLGVKYVWLWRRVYVYPGAHFSAGYLPGLANRYAAHSEEETYTSLHGLLLGGDLLLGVGFRISRDLSIFIEARCRLDDVKNIGGIGTIVEGAIEGTSGGIEIITGLRGGY